MTVLLNEDNDLAGQFAGAHRGVEPARSQTEKAQIAIEEMIVTLKMPPESSWTEMALCQLLDMGRTPVREAIQRLALMQLVKVVPRHGIIVSPINVGEQMMVVEMRRPIDRLIVSRVTKYAKDHERSKIRSFINQTLETAKHGDQLNNLRVIFEARNYLAKVAGNKFATQALASLNALTRRFFYATQVQSDGIGKAGDLYARLFEAIADGDEALAIQRSDEILDYVEDYTKTSI